MYKMFYLYSLSSMILYPSPSLPLLSLSLYPPPALFPPPLSPPSPPLSSRCKDLYLLETYTTEIDIILPDFLEIISEVTANPDYSMSRLSLKH